MADLVEEVKEISEIAVIDFNNVSGTFPNVNGEELNKVAEKFGIALNEVGFAYILNHGVDMALVSNFIRIGFGSNPYNCNNSSNINYIIGRKSTWTFKKIFWTSSECEGEI